MSHTIFDTFVYKISKTDKEPGTINLPLRVRQALLNGEPTTGIFNCQKHSEITILMYL